MGFDTSDKLNDITTQVDEKTSSYFTDVFTPGETKEQLEIGHEVKSISLPGIKEYCIATFTGTLSNSSSISTMTLDTYATNDSLMSATTSRITIAIAGQYIVSGKILWNASSVGYREAIIRLSGSTAISNNFCVPVNGDYVSLPISFIYTFAAGDYIEIRARQTSGSALSIIGDYPNSFLSVHQL